MTPPREPWACSRWRRDHLADRFPGPGQIACWRGCQRRPRPRIPPQPSSKVQKSPRRSPFVADAPLPACPSPSACAGGPRRREPLPGSWSRRARRSWARPCRAGAPRPCTAPSLAWSKAPHSSPGQGPHPPPLRPTPPQSSAWLRRGSWAGWRTPPPPHPWELPGKARRAPSCRWCLGWGARPCLVAPPPSPRRSCPSPT
mmetsp:Transcript_37528/g.71917  ORF Transcript_37528/g.71917 Transcript_37528/m.71917 type:complete len:200 (-) Transcript_37528:2349-2948(-)